MPTSSRAGVAVKKQLRSLDAGLKTPLAEDAEALHRTRVATRRLREALPLLLAERHAGRLHDLRHTIRTATRALGAVREMDVGLALVDHLVEERPDLQPALALLRARLVTERLARLHRLRHDIDARTLRRTSRSVAQCVDQAGAESWPREVLAGRLRRRARALRRAIDEAGPLYAPDRLHRVRLATKKLRYGLELAGEVGSASTKRLVDELRRVQDLLGLLHDLQLVEQHARRCFGEHDVPEPILRLAGAVLALLADRMHAQHADYLAQSDRLAQVSERAAAVARRLSAAVA